MPLPSLNLDDLTFAQLFDIARSDLPPEWTDHNSSDPGIALLEMLCWLGEMTLYRMNRVPFEHRSKFLDLLLDPPVPVTLSVELAYTPPQQLAGQANAARAASLPAGLQFVTEYAGGRRTLFESFARTALPRPLDREQAVHVQVRAIRELHRVPLGVSDGTPNQTFAIPLEAGKEAIWVDPGAANIPSLRAGDDAAGQGSTESAEPGGGSAPGGESQSAAVFDPRSGYFPNPRVRVDGEAWALQSSLRNPASRAGAGRPAHHFAVAESEARIRFGDGQQGAIPPPGARVELEFAQLLQGSHAMIRRGTLLHLLNPEKLDGLPANHRLVVRGNTDAQGGENFLRHERRTVDGLAAFRNPSRLVTQADFERVVLQDFNGFEARFHAATGLPTQPPPQVARAVALMNQIGPIASAGHVTLLVIPRYTEPEFDPAAPWSPDQRALELPELSQRLRVYLEERRLLTTRIHVMSPALRAVSIRLGVAVEAQRSGREMTALIMRALHDFLSLTRGFDGNGWPIGGALRRSQLFALLEALPGVDHVTSLQLQPAGAQGDVLLEPLELPVWDWSPSHTSVQIARDLP